MTHRERKVRRNRARVQSSKLGFEGLEPRTVLSGMPIDLQSLAVTSLTRLSGGRLPPVESSGPVADVEAAGFSVTLSSRVPNGLPVRVMVTAVGSDGRPVPFSGEATISSSDPSAKLPETVTLTRGRALVSVTFATAGEQTLSVTTSGEIPVTGTGTTQVAEPIVATQLAVLLPTKAKVGMPVQVMVMAVDANGRSVPSFNGELVLSSSDEAATLPEAVTFQRGRALATVTFGTEGDQTLAARAGDLVAQATTSVAAQPAVADFRIELRPEVVAGSSTVVAAVAVAADGRVIRDFSGSATLTSSDQGARLPETVRFHRGRAVFQVAFAAVGEQQLTVASGDVQATAATIVKAAPAVASLRIWMPLRTVVGVPTVAQVMALDSEGRPVRGFNGTLDVTSSDAGARLPPSVRFINGVALIRVSFATIGEQTLTVRDPANAEVAGTAATQVMDVRLPSLPPVRRR